MIVRQAISNSKIIGNKLKLDRVYNANELKYIYNVINKALLSASIPNWRVIGFKYQLPPYSDKSVIRTKEQFGMSLIELSEKFHQVIPVKCGGTDTEAGAFHSIDEVPEKVNSLFVHEYGVKLPGTAVKTVGIFRNTNKSTIGALMTGLKRPNKEGSISRVTTDDLWYCQFEKSGAEFPEMLLNNRFICNLDSAGFGDTVLILFIKRGTGLLTYAETQMFFDNSIDSIMPCEADYDLSSLFTIAVPESGVSSDEFTLCYYEDINTNALSEIIREYGTEVKE